MKRKNKCKICGRDYFRRYCENCRRKEKHLQLPMEKRLPFLPVRIIKELPELDFSNIPDKNFQNLFLFGIAGSGKTMYAAKLCEQIIINSAIKNTACQIRFVSCVDLLQELKDTYQKESTISEREIIDKYNNADWLVLDDVGVEKTSDWAFQTLYLIINYRYENLRGLIITSNLNLNELGRKWQDERIVSRIGEMCKVLEFTKNKRKRV